MTALEFIDRLGPEAKVQKDGAGWKARCPAHADRNPSLSVGIGDDGRILLRCFAGCPTEAVCAAAGLKLADLMPPRTAGNGKPRIVAEYPYQDETGKLLFQVCRFDPKDFRQRRPDSTAVGGWTWSTKGVRKVLFRLPELLAMKAQGEPIFVCEGEKDALALVKQGFTATCNPGGAGKWLDEYSESLRGADVVIIPDRDEPGRKHGQLVASKLKGVASRVRVVELPDVGSVKIKDAHDFFAAGGTAEALLDLLNSAPNWTAETQPGPAGAGNVACGAADVRGEIIHLLSDKELSAVEKRTLIAKAVVNALTLRGKFFFHAELRDFDSAMFFDGERKILRRVRADEFRAWLSDWLAINRADATFAYVTAAVETAALSGEQSTGILPELFWASRPGAIYLSNGDGALVKINGTDIALLDNGADGILFPVGRTLAPWKLSEPQDPFESCAIFRDPHCGATHGRDLLRLWLHSLPANPRCKPPLCLAGEIGSGKTRLAKAIAELYGLPFVAAKVEENLENNFWPAIAQGGIFTLDNADSKCRWLADALANASTDGGSERRRLYTDADMVMLRPRSWVIVTSSNPSFAGDAGLADRLLLVRMNRHGEDTSDSRLSDEILAARDAALSHLAATLQTALADTASTPPGLNQRHPDFASFAVKIGRAFGREAETVAALTAAEADKSAFCLENDIVAAALLTYLHGAGSFTGTAAELAPHLIATDSDLAERLSAKRLGKRLAALWPHLAKALAVARCEKDRKNFTVFTFKTGNSAEFAEFESAIFTKPPS